MKRMLITGGAGFIGSNAAIYFEKRGWDVWILDNLSRPGASQNQRSLTKETNATFIRGDVRSREDVEAVFTRAGNIDAVLHLAAQVAVTTSVTDPVTDFEVNALGTFNVLEAARKYAPDCSFIYASTNKVYGNLEHRKVILNDGRYTFESLEKGVNEKEPLDFHSPYGCSKGAADQYVADYARIYGMRTFVIRQSCIYGTRQHGVEDQGWVAWFTIASLFGKPITIYGDGRQVRDVLWVGDLLDLYELCIEKGVPGSIYNAGGGPENSVSILEVMQMLESRLQKAIAYGFSDWRPGDQKVFISDNSKALRELGWAPSTSIAEGLNKLTDWCKRNEQLLADLAVELGMPAQEPPGRGASWA